MSCFCFKQWLKSSGPYLNLLGIIGFIFFWYLFTERLKLPWFNKLPGPVEVYKEWVSDDPAYGISLYTPEYYHHILISIWRVLQAFFLATVLGVPVGLFMGWKKTFKDYTFPLLETLRPIPMLAWVPLSILMWPGREASIIFLTFLGSFFATVLNTLLGVESIDEVYFRAANSLGAKPKHVFFKIILPGSLPFIFTGLQISMGFAWFSLVAGEMLAGEYGLGYLIWNSFIMVQYPVIVIAMVTLGVIGWLSSAIIRVVGDRLMQWKVREAA
ncbi:MAG: ABC transporter permease [Deltaproteobacteria bacterium HGW-Deltaproteobacteria-8]|jgi:NitT/TauT family transport system permease protein|nr:MAG: ABC transporter permease [Deltaproteobacteria bacterium HGW-Deltaproteobacteria-8]